MILKRFLRIFPSKELRKQINEMCPSVESGLKHVNDWGSKLQNEDILHVFYQHGKPGLVIKQINCCYCRTTVIRCNLTECEQNLYDQMCFFGCGWVMGQNFTC